MKVKEIITLLEEFAPLAYAEDFDNTGLLVGDQEAKVTGILITLDTLEAVVEEAIEKKCNLIVSFHPILFKGLKKLTGANYVQRVVQKAIKNDIHIFKHLNDTEYKAVQNLLRKGKYHGFSKWCRWLLSASIILLFSSFRLTITVQKSRTGTAVSQSTTDGS